MRIFSLLLCCFSLLAQAQESQPYLFSTLRTLVQAEQELGRSQSFGTRDSLMLWLHQEQQRLILQVAGTPDKRVQSDILEVESALREVQALAGLRFALSVSRPPAGFSVVHLDQLSLLDDSWLTEKLTTALTYTGALRTLAPSLDWHIVSLMVQPAKPAPSEPVVAEPVVARTAALAATPATPEKPVSIETVPLTRPQQPAPESAAAVVEKPARPLPEEQPRALLPPAPALPQPASMTPLSPLGNSPEAIRLGLTRPRRAYTRMAAVILTPRTLPAGPRPLDSLGTARLEPANFSLETVPPESQTVTDTVARWVIRQTAARYAALQSLEIDSVVCQTTISVQGYAAQTLGNYAEVALKQVQGSFPGFSYSTKIAESSKNKKVSLTGHMVCQGQKPEFK